MTVASCWSLGDRRPPYSGPVPRRRRSCVALAAVVAVALAAAACSPDSDRRADRRTGSSVSEPTTDTTSTSRGADDQRPPGLPAGWTPQRLSWTDCDEGECATLTVPLDWSRPDGPQIDLALGRIRATGADEERLGSILTNPGGPGGSGVEFVAAGPFEGVLAERFDQVSWDPRGVARSDGLTCAEDAAADFLDLDPDPDTPQEQADLDRAAAEVSAACAADAELLAHVGTVDVARDLEAIRLALEDGPLNYVGFSYGTQIGQAYAAMFPTSIRTMVLDGVVDPALGFTEFLMGQVDGFEAAFARNAERCRADTRSCGVSDLAAAYDEVHARLEQEPLRSGGRHVGPAELATAAIYSAYGSDRWKRLGSALEDALDGDGARIAALAEAYEDLGGYSSYAGVVCSDTPPPASPAEWQAFAAAARERSPRFGGSVANELLPCATWPVRSTQVPAPVTAPGAPPILVVGNSGDPATPLSNASAVATALSSGVLVTADISGHTAYGRDECSTRIIESYLISLAVPPDDTTCPD